MNNLSSALVIILVTFFGVALMLWMVLRPLLRVARSSGPVKLVWLVVAVLLTLLSLAALSRSGK